MSIAINSLCVTFSSPEMLVWFRNFNADTLLSIRIGHGSLREHASRKIPWYLSPFFVTMALVSSTDLPHFSIWTWQDTGLFQHQQHEQHEESSLKIRTIAAPVDATCSRLVICLLQHIAQYYWFGSQVLYHGQDHARRVIGGVFVCYSCFSWLCHDQEYMSSKSFIFCWSFSCPCLPLMILGMDAIILMKHNHTHSRFSQDLSCKLMV